MKFTQKKTSRSGDAMVPLINVVFLLVIFFMLAGVMEAAPPFPVAVPETHQHVDAEKGKATVFISEDGEIAMSGGCSGIEAVLAQLKVMKADNKAFRVLLQADGRGSFLSLSRVTQELHAAGFRNISLLAAEGAK